MHSNPRSRDLAALRLLDDSVRRRLYDWVIGQPDAVGREAAAAGVGVSRGLAAFHLEKLVDAGLLEASYRRLSGRVGPGAGRPARVYRRSEREFSVTVPERRYERAATLFASALERLGDGGPPPELSEAARQMGRELARGAGRGSGRARLLRALEQGGYEPVTDTHGTIRLRNCPFDTLAEAHRTLVCGTNLALADGIVAGVGATGTRPVLDRQPGFCCVVFPEESR
ncbi:MAG TPA: transcriptional regulator [Candidatus Limnocylindria bacterium]